MRADDGLGLGRFGEEEEEEEEGDDDDDDDDEARRQRGNEEVRNGGKERAGQKMVARREGQYSTQVP